MRVCLDTSVLIAAFATRGLCADVLRTVLAEHELIIGDVILEEFRDVLKRKFRLPPQQISAALAVAAGVASVPRPVKPSPLKIRDEADRWVLATALDGKAAVLVTGDADLLAVHDRAPIATMDPRAFWELLRRGTTRA